MEAKQSVEEIISQIEGRIEGLIRPEKADSFERYITGMEGIIGDSLIGYNFHPIERFLRYCSNDIISLIENKVVNPETVKRLQTNVLEASIICMDREIRQIKKKLDISDYVSLKMNIEDLLVSLDSFVDDGFEKSSSFKEVRLVIMEKFDISESDLVETKERNRQIKESIRKKELRREKAPGFLKWLFK